MHFLVTEENRPVLQQVCVLSQQKSVSSFLKLQYLCVISFTL